MTCSISTLTINLMRRVKSKITKDSINFYLIYRSLCSTLKFKLTIVIIRMSHESTQSELSNLNKRTKLFYKVNILISIVILTITMIIKTHSSDVFTLLKISYTRYITNLILDILSQIYYPEFSEVMR